MRAWSLWQQGWKQKDIAIALGVTKGAVSQWIKRGREGGAEGLRRRIAKGAASRMRHEQRAQLPMYLVLGAENFGYRGNVWTGQQVAEVIKRVFGISYHQDHCGRLLRQLGWSVQKPIERATQRNEEVIKHWKEQQWPALQKKAAAEKQTIIFVTARIEKSVLSESDSATSASCPCQRTSSPSASDPSTLLRSCSQ